MLKRILEKLFPVTIFRIKLETRAAIREDYIALGLRQIVVYPKLELDIDSFKEGYPSQYLNWGPTTKLYIENCECEKLKAAAEGHTTVKENTNNEAQ